MSPLYRLLSARYLLHRWSRAALIVASIALGVATLVSSRILNQCLETAAAQTTTPLPGAADLLVTNGELGVERRLADAVRAAAVPGVASVQPLLFERVTAPGLGNRAVVLIGTELGADLLKGENPLGVAFTQTAERNWQFARLALNRRLVALSKPLYDDWVAGRADPTAPFVLRSGTRDVDCLPVGYFEFPQDSPAKALGRNVAGMEVGQAAGFLRPGPPPAAGAVAGGAAVDPVWEAVYPPRVNRLDLRLAPGADVAAVQRGVQAVVGDRAAVRTPEAQGRSTQEIVGGIQVGFSLCSAGAMVVGLFLVYNALAVTVAERRRDIGILRSIGATRGQIVALFGAAAAVLGLLGAAAGIPLGVGLARGVIALFDQELSGMFLNPEVNPGTPTAATMLLAALAGVVTAVAAALIPAVQAAHQDPADAVRRGPRRAGPGWRAAHRLTCLALIAGGVTLILLRHELPARVGAFGGMMAALVGLLLAAPILVGGMVRVMYPVLRRVLPVEARLAADNLLRSPGRTGVVIGALGAGVAVMVQTSGVARSNEVPVVGWLTDVIQADQFVFAGSVMEASSSQTPMDPGVVADLRGLPGVAGVVGVRYVRPQFNGTTVFLVAIDAQTYADQAAARRPGRDGMAQLAGLAGAGNRVLVSENFAHKHGVRVGEAITLPGPRGPVALDVVGTVRDYSWARGTIFLDRAEYARLFGDPRVDVLHVYRDGAGPGAVSGFAADRGLGVVDRDAMRKFLADLIDRLYVLAFLQQIVVGVVAALGVVTALLISVLQRKRELGLLLAVGATPRQVVRSVLAEAALMGAFGTLLGVLIGLPLEWYILRVVLVEESGFVFDLLVPWRQVALIGGGAMLVATLAGLVPALHAVRMSIPEAVAHE